MHTSCTCTLLSREAPGRHLKPRRAQPTHPIRGTNRTSPHYLPPRNIVTGARVNARGKVIVPFLSKLNKRIPSQHVAVVEAVSYSGYAAVYVASLAAMHRVGADASSGGALRIYRWKRMGGSHAPHDRNATKHVELQRNLSSLSHLTWLPAHRSCVFVSHPPVPIFHVYGKVIVPFLSKLNKRIPSQHVAVVEAVSYSGYAAVYVASLAAMHRVGADASSGGALRIYRWKRMGGSHAPHDRNATKHVELQRNLSSLSHLTWLPAHRSCVFVCGRLSRSSDSSDKSLTPGLSRLDVNASCHAGGSQLRRCRHTCGQLPRFCTRTRWVGRRRSAL